MHETPTHQGLTAWHDLIVSREPKDLRALLAPEATFWSPIVFTPQVGADLTALYLTGAMHVLLNETFTYVRQVVDPPHAILEFTTDVDGTTINGVDMITFDDRGRIVDFKVMIRPKKAFDLVHERMAAMVAHLGTPPRG